jgi:hypothetical protein
MRIVDVASVMVLAALACAPSPYPTRPAGLVPWTPGRYVLEATVGRGSLSDQDFRAVLTVAPDGSMSMDSSTGLCRDPSPGRAPQDQTWGRGTFVCGDATYFVQPSPTGVRGTIRASILEEYEAQVPCAPTSNQQVCTIMRTRRISRTAQLTVSDL